MQSKQNVKEQLKEFQAKFNPYLQVFLQSHLATLQHEGYKYTDTFLSVLNDVIGNRGGKRGRAAFVNYVYKMYGGTNENLALDLAVVIELTHGYLIIMDDFMDKSSTRRHGPSAHKMFEQFYLKQHYKVGDAGHFGNSISILCCATAFHIAMQVLNNMPISPEVKVALSQNLNKKVEITAYGQLHDVINAASLEASEADVLKMLEWKTGVYTYENPMHSGAILAGVTDGAELSYLSRYAIPAGIAFQIQDDILGVFGQDALTGKSALDDIKEGKYTLLVHKTLELATASQKQALLSAMGDEDLTPEKHHEIKQIMLECGALAYCKNKAAALVTAAKNDLIAGRKPQHTDEGFNFLLDLADYMISREL